MTGTMKAVIAAQASTQRIRIGFIFFHVTDFHFQISLR